MNDVTTFGSLAVVALLALATAAIAWVSKIRSDRQHRIDLDEATRIRDKQIHTLEQQVDFLRQLEAIKFVERYIATRRGLQHRLDRLVADVEAGHAREKEIEREIRELSRSDEERDEDVQRLRAELSRNQQEAHRLEQAIDAVYSIGEIQVDDIRKEVARRRRLAVELKGRIERLALDADSKVAEIARLRSELETGREAMESLKRELELTRSAGPIVDGLLGIDEELADQVDDIDHNLAQAGLDLGSDADAETVGHFLSVVERERSQRGRLLGAGDEAAGAAQSYREEDPARITSAGFAGAAASARPAGTPVSNPGAAAADASPAGAAASSVGAEGDAGGDPDPWDVVTGGASGNGAHSTESDDAAAGARSAADDRVAAGDRGARDETEAPAETERGRTSSDGPDATPDPPLTAPTVRSGPAGTRTAAPTRPAPTPRREPAGVPGPVVAESAPAEKTAPDADPPEPRVWY